MDAFIYLLCHPLSSVLDDINKAKIFNMIKTNSEVKNNNRLNLLEIICPNITMAKTYSALLTKISINRFFSLSLNFITKSKIPKPIKFVKALNAGLRRSFRPQSTDVDYLRHIHAHGTDKDF